MKAPGPGRRGDAEGDGGRPPEWELDRPWLRRMWDAPRVRLAFGLGMLALLAAVVVLAPVVPGGPGPDGGTRWISGRHWVQAWSAVREARVATDPVRAAAAWRRAVAHDPLCLECEREQLAALLREEPPTRLSLTNGTRHGLWLLQAGRTNPADVALLARLLLHHGEAREAVVLLEPVAPRLGASGLPVYFEARMADRSFANAGPVWAGLDAATRRDPVVRWHELAWRVGWGPAGEVPAARRGMAELEREVPVPVAARVRLELAVSSGVAQEAEEALGRLRAAGRATPSDAMRVVALWRSSGRPDRAKAGLDRAGVPRSGDEAMQWADLALGLGEADRALACLREACPRFDEARLWLRCGDLLVERGDWAGAAALARRMREESGEAEVLRPYRLFLELVTAEKSGREAEGSTAQRELARMVRGDPSLLWRVAGLLVRFGHPREAQALLAACEAAWSRRPDYWELAHRAATASDDVEGMLVAARRAWELAPGDPVKADRLGAALVALRRDPVEAVRVTLEAVTARPGNARFRANRALALIQLGRDEEGAAMLSGLEAAAAGDPWIRTMICLGRFEMHSRAGDGKAATSEYLKIDSRQLLPPQVMWLERRFEGKPDVPAQEAARRP